MFKIRFHKPLKSLTWGVLPDIILSEKKIQHTYQEGYENGRLAAEQFYNMQLLEYRKELASLQESLTKNMEREYVSMVEDFKKRMPQIILNLLKKVWSHLEWNCDDVRAMVDEALMAYAPDEMPLEVYLSASDMALFEEMNIHQNYAHIIFKEDLSLDKGDCFIKSRFGILDSRVDTKLKRVEEELSHVQ